MFELQCARRCNDATEILNEFIEKNLPAQVAKKRKTAQTSITSDKTPVEAHEDVRTTVAAELESFEEDIDDDFAQ
jgi:hypothetical protein